MSYMREMRVKITIRNAPHRFRGSSECPLRFALHKHKIAPHDWTPRVLMIPTLSSLMAPNVVIKTTFAGTSDDEIVITITHVFQCVSGDLRRLVALLRSKFSVLNSCCWSTIISFGWIPHSCAQNHPELRVVVMPTLSPQWWQIWYHIDGVVKERRNSIANALELGFSCTNPSISTLGIPWRQLVSQGGFVDSVGRWARSVRLSLRGSIH